MTDSGFPSLACEGLVGGTSGAPWVSGTTVTGVIGGLEGGGCAENVSYSAPFDERTAQLLTRADAGGPGDTVPNDLAGDPDRASARNWLSARTLFITSSAATLYASEKVG